MAPSFTYLQDHAMRFVWSNPWQDIHMLFKPARLTPVNGVEDSVTLQWRRLDLPKQNVRYHAYQIGHLHPALALLAPVSNQWINVADAMASENIMIDLFNIDGVHLPRLQCYYIWTAQKNLVFLVPVIKDYPANINSDELMVRIYANSFFTSGLAGASGVADYVRCVGGYASSTSARNSILQTYATYKAQRGDQVRVFANGYLVESLTATNFPMGAHADIVIDTSIKEVITHSVSDLLQFNSTMDAKYKYLLKSPREGMQDVGIDYFGDIDFYIVNNAGLTTSKGVYYHQSEPDAVRTLTHADYSIPTTYLDAYRRAQSDWDSLQSLSVRMFVRSNGRPPKMVDESSRIKELYKLPYAQCQRSMIGLDATLAEWQVDSLESSSFAALTAGEHNGITTDMVQSAYGYNAIAKLVGDAPTQSLSSDPATFAVPYLMRAESVAYEYDTRGILLGFYTHYNAQHYNRRSALTTMVEFVYGRGGSESAFSDYGLSPVNIPKGVSYRCYACSLSASGVSLGDWRDVTGTGAYAVINGQLTWSLIASAHQGLVRFDDGFFTYSTNLIVSTKGYLVHTMPGSDPLAVVKRHDVPMAQYDFWLNGHPLVENIDYMHHGDTIVVVSKDYIVGELTDAQQLVVRGVGFCSTAMLRETAPENGFVSYELLSRDSVFNVHDDKVLRMVVGGALKRREDVRFAEDASPVDGGSPLNGQPYQVKDMIVHFTRLVSQDVYALRQQSQAVDKRVSDYLSTKLPQRTPTGVSAIERLYPLYSPFLAAILHDYDEGVFLPDILNKKYGDSEVMVSCAAYEWLLAFDPARDDWVIDREYVIIHPYPGPYMFNMSVNFYGYLQHVIRIYLHSRVSLSGFTTVSTF